MLGAHRHAGHLRGRCWVPTRTLGARAVPGRSCAGERGGLRAEGERERSQPLDWLAAVAKGELIKAIRILNSNTRVAHQH